MQEILDRLLQLTGVPGESATLVGMTVALVVSTVAAGLARLLYMLFYETRETGAQIHRSFLLMGPSVTLLFITVQISLPLSLGLLGALSIVRFRVPIKEPEEIGFLMVVIASSIACATYSYALLVILFAIVIVVLVGTRLFDRLPLGHGSGGGLVLLSLRDADYQEHAGRIEQLLSERIGRVRLEHMDGREGVTNLNYAFRGRAGIDWGGLKQELTRLCQPDSISVLFSRQGGL